MKLNRFWLICLVTICPALEAGRRGAAVRNNKSSIAMLPVSERKFNREAAAQEAKENRMVSAQRRRPVQECNCLKKIVRAIFCCSRR